MESCENSFHLEGRVKVLGSIVTFVQVAGCY